MMIFLLAALGFIGLAAGSFLTVVVSRLGSGETIARGRSRCVHCAKELRWFELMPVLSFFIQGGHCRSCGKPIPRIYPLIELITGVAFALLGWALAERILPPPKFLAPAFGVLTMSDAAGFAPAFFYYAFFAAAAIAVSFYDLTRRLVPYALILPLALVGSLGQIAGALRVGSWGALLLSFAAGAAWFLFFWSLWFFSKGRAMGRGDADAALAVALYLGPAVSSIGFLFAFWFGALTGILLMAAGRLGWRSQMPFTPFMFMGAMAALFASDYLFMLGFG